MAHPQKWRETCDPFGLNYHAFQPTEILGYPHAGNDVFHAKGLCEDKEITAYIKVARQRGAAIENEVALLQQLDDPLFPKVIDYDFDGTPFSATAEMPGRRLSVILGENEDMASLTYIEEYGEVLGKIHNMTPAAKPVADRKFFHRPPNDLLEKLDLVFLKTYFDQAPAGDATVFCHGDFHYANILWEDRHISSILDFELSGYGNRDFDTAWALILRPGQKFLKTEAERQKFLTGYSKYGQYDARAVRYYMAQIYVYFLEFSGNDADYCNYVRVWLADTCR